MRIIIFVFLLFTFYFLLFTPIYAGHPFGQEGYYCDGNEVWHDIPGNQFGKPYGHELKDPCGGDQVCVPQPPTKAIYVQDAACLDIDTLPASGNGTSMRVTKSPVTLGEQLTIGIGADKTCYDTIKIDPNADQNGNSIKVFGRLLNCHITDQHCGCETKHTPPKTDAQGKQIGCQQTACDEGDWSINSPRDACTNNQLGFNPYDNKKCFYTVVCDTNSEGTLNAPLVTNNSNCNNNTPYQVVPTTPTTEQSTVDCNKVEHTVKTQWENDLVDKSMVDNHENVVKRLNGTVPKEATVEATSACLNKPVKTGVLGGAFGLQDFLCKQRFLQNIPLIGSILSSATVCPKDTFVGGTDTDCMKELAVVLSKSATPNGVNKEQKKDCAVVTYKQGDGQPSAGEAALSTISKSLGGPNGYISHTQPEFPLDLNHNVNLNTEGYVLTGSDQGPDINARCNKDCLANYPQELCLPDNSIECQDVTSTGNTPPAEVEACRQACFAKETKCEKDNCTGKTGGDLNNCANECVITKDKCLKACGG